MTIIELMCLEVAASKHVHVGSLKTEILISLGTTRRLSVEPMALLRELGSMSPEQDAACATVLYILECDRKVILERGAGGLALPDGTSCTLVSLRGAA